MKKVILALLAFASTQVVSQGLYQTRIATIGDSHTTVEAGFGKAFGAASKTPVEHRNYGVVGATLYDLDWSIRTKRGHFARKLIEVRTYSPAIVILAFGTNESVGWDGKSKRKWLEALQRVSSSIQASSPGATIILAGPPSSKLPMRQSVSEAEKEAAAHLGIGFVDRASILESLGDTDKLMGPDGIHLTPTGYRKLAKAVALEISTIAK